MLKELLKRDVSKQFLRFCFIGLESTVLNYLVFLILLHFILINYVWAYAGGFLAGTLFGFIFNKIWSFESKNSAKNEIGQYFIVYTISLVIGTFFIKFLVNSIELNPLIANIPVIGLTTILNFFGTKIFAFKDKKW